MSTDIAGPGASEDRPSGAGIARRTCGIGVLVAIAVLALGVCGCLPPCPTTLVSVDKVVADYNANAAAAGRLWARAKIAVEVADNHGAVYHWGSTSPVALPNGLLLAGKGPNRLGPHDFVLIGREAGLEIFRLGNSADEGKYYFLYRFGQHAGAWWGWDEFAGAPGVEEMPVDPLGLLAVTGLFELPDDFTQLPVVALSMSRNPCAYVLTCIDAQPVTNRILFKREMLFRWDDQPPRRPYQVNIFAADGRRVLTATLKDYKPIAVPGAPKGKPLPEMPTNILIQPVEWPGRKTNIRSIHLVLSEMTTDENKGDPSEAAALKDKAYLLEGFAPVQVDSPIESGGQK